MRKDNCKYRVSQYFPFHPFVAMNLFGFIIVRKENLNHYDTGLKRHEKIHTIQMIETLFIGFYLWYAIEWAIRVLAALIKRKSLLYAYNSILFEKEAYTNQDNPNYLELRKAFQYKWLK